LEQVRGATREAPGGEEGTMMDGGERVLGRVRRGSVQKGVA